MRAFLTDYDEQRRCGMPNAKVLSFADAIRIANLEQVITLVTADFVRTTLEACPVSVNQDRGLDLLAPSSTELRRIHRALYRFQMFCNLFSHGEDNPWMDIGSRVFDPQDKSFIFLLMFAAWEVEELGCIRDYIISKYAAWFEEVEADLSRYSPRFADELADCPATPVGCYDVSPNGRPSLSFCPLCKADNCSEVRTITNTWSI